MDTSGQYDDKLGTGTKLSTAKTAAKTLLTLSLEESNNQVGLVTFDIGSVLEAD